MRLEEYIHFRPTAAMVDIIVKIMAEVISILGIVTKEIRQSRTSMTFLIDITRKVDLCAGKFLKKLAGRKEVEDAFERLDKLTPEEALMAAAETMTVTRDIDDTVKDVDKRLEGVGSNVQDVNERVKDVDKWVKNADERVKRVDGRVGSIIQGPLSFPPLHWPRIYPLPLLSLGVKEAGVAIQQVFNQVNDLNRESSPLQT